MRAIRTFLAMAVASALASAPLAPGTAAADSECVGGHGRALVTNFTGGVHAGSWFYAAPESAGSVTAAVGVTAGDCTGFAATATYRTVDGTATAPVDYETREGTTGELCADAHPEYCSGRPWYEPVEIDLNNDVVQDARAVESFRFEVVSGSMGVAEPSSAPVHVVDVDGPSRVSLEPVLHGTSAVTYSRSESFPMIRIPVFRAGSAGSQSVAYTVEPAAEGGASADDFSVASANPLSTDSSRLGFIDISIINDRILEDPESLVVTLTDARAVAPSSTTVTILDNEEPTPPGSRFHHPRNKKKYRWNDYRTREFHVFTSDTGGSGVVGVEIALQQRLGKGKCKWWTGKRFARGNCGQNRWIGDLPTYEPDFFYYRMPALKPSMGTSKVRHYTAFSRAIDGAGNVEVDMRRGANVSRFEVQSKRRKR